MLQPLKIAPGSLRGSVAEELQPDGDSSLGSAAPPLAISRPISVAGRINGAAAALAARKEPKVWPKPFWAGGQHKLLEWRDAEGSGTVQFQAQLVEPDGSLVPKSKLGKKLPLIVHLSGVGSSGGISDVRVLQLRRLIRGPFVLVAPVRQRGMAWWVLSEEGDWGWVDGDLVPSRVKTLTAWLRVLSCDANVNPEWVSLLGYSAGAYAVTELCASGALQLRSLVLGGIHGLGQPDGLNLDGRRVRKQAEIVAKWDAYLVRISLHCGLPGGIFGSHHREDSICPWSHAETIFETLSQRQEELGFPPVTLEEVTIVKVGKKKAKSVHNYSDQTFLKSELWEKLLPYNEDGSLIAEADIIAPDLLPLVELDPVPSDATLNPALMKLLKPLLGKKSVVAASLAELPVVTPADISPAVLALDASVEAASPAELPVVTPADVSPAALALAAVVANSNLNEGAIPGAVAQNTAREASTLAAPSSCDIYRDGVVLSRAVGWAAGAAASACLASAGREYRSSMIDVLRACRAAEVQDRNPKRRRRSPSLLAHRARATRCAV